MHTRRQSPRRYRHYPLATGAQRRLQFAYNRRMKNEQRNRTLRFGKGTARAEYAHRMEQKQVLARLRRWRENQTPQGNIHSATNEPRRTKHSACGLNGENHPVIKQAESYPIGALVKTNMGTGEVIGTRHKTDTVWFVVRITNVTISDMVVGRKAVDLRPFPAMPKMKAS